MRLFGPTTVVLSVMLGAGGIAYQTPTCSDANCSVAKQEVADDGQCQEQAPSTPQRVEVAKPLVRTPSDRAPAKILSLNAQGYNYPKEGPPTLPAAPESK